jgi:hypothetical protein
MPPQRVELRVQRLEQKVSELEQLPARMAELGSQIAQLRGEMHEEFSAIRREVADRVTLAQFREATAAIGEELRAFREQFSQELRAVRGEFSEELRVIRGELRAIRGNGAGLSLVKLHEEIAGLRGPGGEGLTLVGLRQEIREGDEETRRLMRVLHEDLVQRIPLLGEKRSSAGVAPRRRGPRGKKNHGRKR